VKSSERTGIALPDKQNQLTEADDGPIAKVRYIDVPAIVGRRIPSLLRDAARRRNPRTQDGARRSVVDLIWRSAGLVEIEVDNVDQLLLEQRNVADFERVDLSRTPNASS
jgi:hypothetical protein